MSVLSLPLKSLLIAINFNQLQHAWHVQRSDCEWLQQTASDNMSTSRGSKPNRKSRGKMLHFPIARRRYCRYICLPSDSVSLTLLSPTTSRMLAQLFPQPPSALLVSVYTGACRHLRTLEDQDVQRPIRRRVSSEAESHCRSFSHHSLWRHWILSLPHDRFSVARTFLHATRMREMRGTSLFTYTEIYLYRSLLRTPFGLLPPLPVERPSLLGRVHNKT